MSTLAVVGGRVLCPDMTVERADVLVDQESGTIEAVGDPDTVPDGDGLDCPAVPVDEDVRALDRQVGAQHLSPDECECAHIRIGVPTWP